MKTPARRLLVFLALVALGPLVLRLTSQEAIDGEAPERIPAGATQSPGADLIRTPRILAKIKPEIVFMGNSMVNSRIDGDVFTAETGFRTFHVSRASTETAIWYLYLKNIIAPLKQKPKVVVVFFRDRFLTWPAYRTTGIYAPYLESLRQPNEPLLDKILWDPDSAAPVGARARFDHTVRAVYGIGNQPARVHENLTELAFDLTGFGVRKVTRRSQMALRFGLENLRGDIGDDVGDDTAWNSAKTPIFFSPSPAASFLPHMLDLAREHRFTLCFFRVKRRCDVDGTRGDDPQLAPYLADLGHFIRENGGILIDESTDPIPLEWYSDGDHIGAEHRPDYTRLFWKKSRPVLEPLLSGETP